MAVTTHTGPPRAARATAAIGAAATSGAAATTGATGSGVETRVRWWALALPVLAFVTLLLILNPADAQATTGQPAILHLLERLQQLVLR